MYEISESKDCTLQRGFNKALEDTKGQLLLLIEIIHVYGVPFEIVCKR